MTNATIIIHHSDLTEVLDAHQDVDGPYYVSAYRRQTSDAGVMRLTVEAAVRYVDKAGHIHSFSSMKSVFTFAPFVNTADVSESSKAFGAQCEENAELLRSHLRALGARVFKGIVDLGGTDSLLGRKFTGENVD